MFRYFEDTKGLATEQRIKGKCVITVSESALSVLEIMAIYKELGDAVRRFRQFKRVLVVWPICRQI
jgi:hypothetical protein